MKLSVSDDISDKILLMQRKCLVCGERNMSETNQLQQQINVCYTKGTNNQGKTAKESSCGKNLTKTIMFQ